MKSTCCAKAFFPLGMVAAVLMAASSSVMATILYQANDVTWQGGGAIPSINLSQPMTKTDTYYIQYTVELTSSVPPYTGGDPNNKNASYPNVALANATNGGAAFHFYIGGGYNSDYILSSGFSSSTWNTNQFSATDGTGGNNSSLVSTGLVAQYSTTEYGVVKYQVGLTLNMAAGTYDYQVVQLNGSGNVVAQATLSGLDLVEGNYWNNNSTFSTLAFQSSTSQMTAHFDSIIVSTTPIPEPGTFVLAGLGISLVCLSRRRRKD